MEEIPEAQDGVCGADGNSFNDPFFQQDNEPMVRRNPSSCIEGHLCHAHSQPKLRVQRS